ncbi:hypothetical protein LUZ60_012489 [Juncus effusus]|nr:hypothetical protein LUZ60_012489 [Juncus effusus]
MASISIDIFATALLMIFLPQTMNAQLSTTFYDKTCPNAQQIVCESMAQAVKTEPRMGASILRLFYHDCFVQGCDASVLLTPTFNGEKNADPNKNSIRGFEVIDSIKSNVEKACESTVSCADILALAARDAVELLGGPTWQVKLGRRDSLNASLEIANTDLPKPNSTLAILISKFAVKGLNARKMTALFGAHSIGQAGSTFTMILTLTLILLKFVKVVALCQVEMGICYKNKKREKKKKKKATLSTFKMEPPFQISYSMQ